MADNKEEGNQDHRRRRQSSILLPRRQRIVRLLHQAAAKELSNGDPWASYHLEKFPAERIIRHMYDFSAEKWYSDETIVKIEQEPFTHGAMRFCYRMKKRSPPPQDSSNSRFHKMGWNYASNYVAKAYHKNSQEMDVSVEAKSAVQNDILLQHEAQRWAEQFNLSRPPSQIHFLRAYAIEFPNRDGQPWMAVERFIVGHDRYGAGFTKHNTNSGYVNSELRRITPQVFSAFTFYKSNGHRLVADIQGVGDLYTDPQILSSDYRFGDGDLGPRGMALFFQSFRHHQASDAMGIPIFALSKNEQKVQAKYDEDEETMSASATGDGTHSRDQSSFTSGAAFAVAANAAAGQMSQRQQQYHDDEHHDFERLHGEHDIDESHQEHLHRPPRNKLEKLDLNRLRRSSLLKSPRDLISFQDRDTDRRTNLSRDAIRQSIRMSMTQLSISSNTPPPTPTRATASIASASPQKAASNRHHHRRSKSTVDEVKQCLELAKENYVFEMKRDFRRKPNGQLIQRKYKSKTKKDAAAGATNNTNDDEDDDEDDDDDESEGEDDAAIAAAVAGSTGKGDGGKKNTSENNYHDDGGTMNKNDGFRRGSAIVRAINKPIIPTRDTIQNLGKVHYQLAVLHGVGRFPEVIEAAYKSNSSSDAKDDTTAKPVLDPLDLPSHDVMSVLFHLSYASAFEHPPACLALGRVQAGLPTTVCNLINGIVPTRFEDAKHFLQRALSSPFAPPTRPQTAAGCLLYQIMKDEREIANNKGKSNDNKEDSDGHTNADVTGTSITVLAQVLEETIKLLKTTEKEENESAEYREKHKAGAAFGVGGGYMVGDKVQGNYCLEGTFYPGVVVALSDDGETITIQYDDDGSEEALGKENVKAIIPPTATQTTLGGPLSDEEAFGETGGGDDAFLVPVYELQAELAELKHEMGDDATASELYTEAADGAMTAGKMKSATEWSLKAGELET